MSQKSEHNRLRSLVACHYRRNRHLTPACDADDLFQESWIHLHQPSALAATAVEDQPSQEDRLRRAVRSATDRVFGKLRKRVVRGAAAERTLDFDPAECVPDQQLVLDLKQQIEALPAEERQVIEMLRCGYAGNEIAEQLCLSPQAVTRRKQRAIERLRQGLTRA